MWCTCIPHKNHQVTQLHQREISQILSRDSGGSRLNIDFVILDHVSSITLRQTSLGQLKSWKHLKSCGIQALGWQLFPHGSIFKRTWSWMLVVALDLRVGKLHQSHVACRSCSFELHWASSLHFFVDTDTSGFSLEETLDESYLQGRPWMQLLDRLPNSRRSSYFISCCFSPIDTFLVELFLWIHHFWKGLETWLFTSFTHISLWDARASQEDLVI